MYQKFLKRLVDISVAGLGLICLSPVFLIVSLLLMIQNKGTAFFLQERPGKNGKAFTILKFKTMRDASDENGIALADELRITSLGKIIRKTSLDELPQLINVLKGEMSLIGPRPLLMEYLPLYSKEQMRRHEVLPGITGWAQVNGRNLLNWQERFEKDLWYIDNLNLGLDLKIVIKTISNVVNATGVSSENSATMEKFTGNN